MEDSNRDFYFYTDIVICIDATAKMAPLIEQVKNNIQKILSDYIKGMEDEDKPLGNLRVKIIAFRDFKCDDEPMIESPFFSIPDHEEEVEMIFNGIEAKGGSDDGANALEALALAIKSDWTTGGCWRRHLVMLYTNGKTIPLGERKDCQNYPEGMPADLEELGNWWQGVTEIDSTFMYRAGRLVAFVPECYPWAEIQTWNRYWPAYLDADINLTGIDLQAVVDLLVGVY